MRVATYTPEACLHRLRKESENVIRPETCLCGLRKVIKNEMCDVASKSVIRPEACLCGSLASLMNIVWWCMNECEMWSSEMSCALHVLLGMRMVGKMHVVLRLMCRSNPGKYLCVHYVCIA